ncbi:MAG: ABC transporter ATP-binding protein [Rhodospirillaceae bacterium]
MISSIVHIYRLVLPEFRPQFCGIVGASIVVAILETLGVASMMPLLAVMLDPGRLSGNSSAGRVLALLGLDGALPPIHIIAFVTIGLFIVTNIGALAVGWWSVRLSARLATTLSEQFARAHFRQPFTFFLVNRPAELANSMCSEVARVVSGGVVQLCAAITRSAQLLAVIALLILMAPLFSTIYLLVVAGVYGLIYRYTASHMAVIGVKAHECSGRALHSATEMYAMAREISLKGDCRYFVRRVCEELDIFYRADADSRILPTLPKYALEISATCALFALPIYRSMMGSDARAELPLLATFAYAGLRLLPAAQQLYSSLTILKFHSPIASRLWDAFSAPTTKTAVADRLTEMPPVIEFRGVGFAYAGRDGMGVSNIDFRLSRGERIAVVGDSGAGKSTLIDLVLGLLAPTVGTILVDGRPAPDGALAWKEGVVGYVPQAPLILTESVASNIAFGCGEAEIDLGRCRSAAAAAGILAVVENCPDQFATPIGVGTINFSGGERQRLAIARALYSQPELLILDEPASSLDPANTQKIFELLSSPDLAVTVLVVTHNHSFLEHFDTVVFMQQGRIVMAAPYDELMAKCPDFVRFVDSGRKKRAEP